MIAPENFTTEIFCVSSQEYLRFHINKAWHKALPALVLILIGTVALAVYDVGYALALVMLTGVSLPFAGILYLNRILDSRRIFTLPMSASWNGTLLSIEIFPEDAPSDQTFQAENIRFGYFKHYLVAYCPGNIILIPASAVSVS